MARWPASKARQVLAALLRIPGDTVGGSRGPEPPRRRGAVVGLRGRLSGMNGRGLGGSNGGARKRAKAPKRAKGGVSKAQQAARRKFLADSPVKPTREGMEAIHRELVGSE